MKYNILVKPGSKKGPLVEKTDDGLTVYLRERPHDGEANAALIGVLAKHFDVPKRDVIILHGAKGHRKIVEIAL